jgi:septal ring factor EnvC (AmiA/AmiB activator)
LAAPQAQAAPQKHHHASKSSSHKAKTKNKTAPRKSTRKRGSRSSDLQSRAQSAQNDLAAVQNNIRATQQTIKLTQAERSQKESELREAELHIGALNQQMRTTETEVAQRQRSLQALAAQRAQHEADRDRQLVQLRQDVQLSYRRGGDDYFKLLLNQQDPAAVARLLKYYGYIQQARADRIQTLNQTLTELASIETAQKTELDKLGALEAGLQQQHGQLAQAQQSRQKAITVLNAQLESQDEKLRRLLSDQSALQNLMQRLEQQARDAARREQQEREAREQAAKAQPTGPTLTPATPPKPAPAEDHWSSAPDYSNGGGHCAMPVNGAIQSSFGSPRAGGLRWNGVLIGSATGTPVHAVKAGRVVYADYLRGYGFLIILDHGHGLMSLYGQNQTLLKSVGDSVNAGDSIAQVGASGGNSSPGLYFEIRVKGRPSNPSGWCGG